MADYDGMEALLASTENLAQLLNNVGHDDDTLTFNGVDWFKFNGVGVWFKPRADGRWGAHYSTSGRYRIWRND